MAYRKPKPSIYQIGTITDDGRTVTVTGWGLSYCPKQCRCHVGPDGGLVLLQHNATGSLGLKQHGPCHCCEPWSYAELQGFLRDLAAVEALATTEEEPA